MPKKVLFLHRGGNQIRGTEEALLTLLRGLDRSRFEPVVFHSGPVMGAALEELGVEGHLREYPELMLTRGEQRLPLLRYARMLREMVAFGRAADVDAILCNGGLPCQLGVPAARWLGVPVVCLFHHPAPTAYYRWWFLARADRLLVASRFTGDHVYSRIGTRGETVYIGIDAAGRFVPPERRDPALRARLGIAPDEVVFSQVGALVPHKKHDLLVEGFARALPRVPGARLVIIGKGPEESRIRELVRARGLSEQVVLTGYVEDITPYFRQVMDVHVLPSSEEGLGLVNLQASACLIPNIGTDGTGIRESIKHGETGYLFPAGDAEALAARMVELGSDPRRREELGRNGRQFVLERFSNQRFCARVEQILLEAMAADSRVAAPVATASRS